MLRPMLSITKRMVESTRTCSKRMFELFGLLIIKLFGHGWLWNRGEKISADEQFGSGSDLLLIGFIGAIVVIFGGLFLLAHLVKP